jgi:hypothetical protein
MSQSGRKCFNDRQLWAIAPMKLHRTLADGRLLEGFFAGLPSAIFAGPPL